MLLPEIRLSNKGDIEAEKKLIPNAYKQLDILHNNMNFQNLTSDISKVTDIVTGHEIICEAYRTPLIGFESIINIYVPPTIPEEIIEEESVDVTYGWCVLVAIGNPNGNTVLYTWDDNWLNAYRRVNERMSPGCAKINEIVAALDTPPVTEENIALDETWGEIKEILFWMWDIARFVEMPMGEYDVVRSGFARYMQLKLSPNALIYFEKWQDLSDVSNANIDIAFQEQYFMAWDIENNTLLAEPGNRSAMEATIEGLTILPCVPTNHSSSNYWRRFEVDVNGISSAPRPYLSGFEMDLGYGYGSNTMFKLSPNLAVRGLEPKSSSVNWTLTPTIGNCYPWGMLPEGRSWDNEDSEDVDEVSILLDCDGNPMTDLAIIDYHNHGTSWCIRQNCSGGGTEYYHYNKCDSYYMLNKSQLVNAFSGSYLVTAQNLSGIQNSFYITKEMSNNTHGNYNMCNNYDPSSPNYCGGPPPYWYWLWDYYTSYSEDYAFVSHLGALAEIDGGYSKHENMNCLQKNPTCDATYNTTDKIEYDSHTDRMKGEWSSNDGNAFAQFVIHKHEAKTYAFDTDTGDYEPTPLSTEVTTTVLASADTVDNAKTLDPFRGNNAAGTQIQDNTAFSTAIDDLITFYELQEDAVEGYDIELRLFKG